MSERSFTLSHWKLEHVVTNKAAMKKTPLTFNLWLVETGRRGMFVNFDYKVTLNEKLVEEGTVEGFDVSQTFDALMRRYLSSRVKGRL